MEVALWGGNYEDGTVERELWRWHCGERTMEVALWGENYGGGTVGRELWRWHCGERTTLGKKLTILIQDSWRKST